MKFLSMKKGTNLIQYWLRKVGLEILCIRLHIMYTFKKKEICLSAFSHNEVLSSQARIIYSWWQLTGCYKIVCENLGEFPGNIAGLKIVIPEKMKQLNFTFIGIKGKKVNVEVLLDKKTLALKTESFSDITLKLINSSLIMDGNAFVGLKKYSETNNSLKFDLDPPKIQGLTLNLINSNKPFIKSKYLNNTTH